MPAPIIGVSTACTGQWVVSGPQAPFLSNASKLSVFDVLYVLYKVLNVQTTEKKRESQGNEAAIGYKWQ